MRIRMANWEDRNPRSDYKTIPWFRMDADFFRNKKLFGLSLLDKWAWACLLGLAAKENSNGLISGPPEWVAEEISYPLEDLPKLVETLERQGLLTTNEDSTDDVRKTNAVRSLRTNVTNERNERTEEGLEGVLFTPKQLLDTWNANCGSLAKVSRLSKTREDKIRARRKEAPDLAYWEGVIKRLAESDLANGRRKNDKYPNGWHADFEWLIKNDNNHLKVAEGKFDNKKSAKPTPSLKVFSSEGDFA